MKLSERLYATFIYEGRWKFFAEGLTMTLLLTIGAFLGGTIFGALFCALRLSKNRYVSKITNAVVQFLIQLPTLVLLMVFVYILFSDASLSTVVIVTFGLMLKCAAYMSDVFYTAVSSTNSGQAEAARALGMTAIQSFLYVTLPQAVETAIPLYQNQFIITLQETSIVGTLAVMDLTKASSIVTSRTMDAFFGLILISVMYILIGVICTSLIGLMKNKKHLGDGEDD